MRKSFWILILVVLIMSILGVIVYFYLFPVSNDFYNEKKKGERIKQTELSDWKTFDDVKSGLSFKYPANGWSISFGGESGMFLYLKNNKTDKESPTIEAFILEDATINEAIENDSIIRLAKKMSQRTDINVGGKEGAKLVGTVSQDGSEDWSYIDVLIQNGKKVIKIILLDKADEDVYNQILSTIKFSN